MYRKKFKIFPIIWRINGDNFDINAEKFAKNFQNLHEILIIRLTKTQNLQTEYYNKNRKKLTLQKKKNGYWTPTSKHANFPKNWITKKLNPFELIKATSPNFYSFQLPYQVKIHSISHVCLFEFYKGNIIKRRVEFPPPFIKKITNEIKNKQYQIEKKFKFQICPSKTALFCFLEKLFI